jgi:hypothetical protein
MKNRLLSYYRIERKPIRTVNIDSGAPIVVRETATRALRNARVRAEWSELSDDQVRLRVVVDDDLDLSYLDQDMYTDKYRADVRTKAENEGGTGIIGEYFDGETWIHADSVYGFIGDDWKASGYDIDIMRATIDAYRALVVCPTCGRAR